MGEQLRLAGAEDVCGSPARIPRAEGVPLVGIRNIEIHSVDVVGPADQLPILVIEGDEEVARVHQLADDAMDGPIELLHVLRRAGQLGDSVQRGLNLVSVVAVSEVRRGIAGLRHERQVSPAATRASSSA